MFDGSQRETHTIAFLSSNAQDFIEDIGYEIDFTGVWTNS